MRRRPSSLIADRRETLPDPMPSYATDPSRIFGGLDTHDPRVQAWERGPWQTMHVPMPDPMVFTLWKHATGRELAVHEFELLVRLMAATGYAGGPIAPSSDRPTRHASTTDRATDARRDMPPGFDPDDLGDTEPTGRG